MKGKSLQLKKPKAPCNKGSPTEVKFPRDQEKQIRYYFNDTETPVLRISLYSPSGKQGLDCGCWSPLGERPLSFLSLPGSSPPAAETNESLSRFEGLLSEARKQGLVSARSNEDRHISIQKVSLKLRRTTGNQENHCAVFEALKAPSLAVAADASIVAMSLSLRRTLNLYVSSCALYPGSSVLIPGTQEMNCQ